MTATVHPTFDLLAPLPVGRLAIEASAGTGKTYALAALATRFVAEADVSIGELLIVTFTRAATTELRARVRTRLADAAAHLAHADPPPTDDPVLTHLARADRALRHARLEQAVTDFDAATISTIHGFSAQVLATIGAAGGADPDLALVDDGLDLAREVCADVLATASVEGHGDLPKLSTLTSDVITALGSPDLVVLPDAEQVGANDADLLHAALVRRAVDAVDRHRRRNGSRGFTDVLTDLRNALRRPATAAAAVAALRSRYRVALIDEFQDTDPVQWAIFSTLFTDPTGTPGEPPSLVLVGDPKQAIYAFRGANVHTYVRAVSGPGGDIRSLATNHRSDGAAVHATEALLGGLTFGSQDIAFAPVVATSEHEHRRLTDDAGEPLPALSIRLGIGDDLRRNKNLTIKQPDGDQAVWSDLAAQVRQLLDHARLPPEKGDGPRIESGDDPGIGRRVRPSDIAVLVRSFKEAGEVQQHLTEQGVPAVLARGGSVLASDAAEQWRWLLDAVARPSDPARARTFALSWFVGHDAGWIATCTDEDLALLQDQLRTWGEALAAGGVTALLRRVWSESGVTARVLARPEGDRAITDLEHLAELFRTQVPGGRASVAALLDTEPEADPDLELEGNLASRRVESEAEAVQILTVWVAKGLEFPITCCPTLWKAPRNEAVIFQDPEHDARAFDLAGGHRWPTEPEARLRADAARREARGEDLRLVYVALTRARHQTLLWWVPAWEADTTGLARVLFGRTDDGRIGQPVTEGPTPMPPDPAEAVERIAALVEPGVIAVGTHGRVTAPDDRWTSTAVTGSNTPLGLSALDRELDRTRNRWSFTAISARADRDHPEGDQAEGAGPDEAPGGADEALPTSGDQADPDAPIPAMATDTPALPTRPELVEDSGQGLLFADATADLGATADDASTSLLMSPLASLPASAEVGTLVHEILEQVAFDGPDLRARLRDELGRQLSWRRLDLTPVGPSGRSEPATPEQGRALLVDGLEAALETPLGPLFDHRPLTSFGAADRLTELGFELRLGEGGRVANDRDIGRLLLDRLPDDDLFRPWAEQVAAGAFSIDLAGHLNGSIDLILRITDPDRPPRFALLDYKTNRLHDRGVAPEPHHYRPVSMVTAMAQHHYPLQALLYAVAVHRYLRWRQPGYDPAVHLAGAAYLFVRGMAGPDTPVTDGQPDGVCAWALRPDVVAALSDLLHGRSS